MVEIIKTNAGYMVQYIDGELESEYMCDAKGNTLFDWFYEAEDVLYRAFDENQRLMNEGQALLYYQHKLSNHGWYTPVVFSIEDVKSHLEENKKIIEMPSNEILKRACSHVARKYPFEDYSQCIEWAAKLSTDIKWE